MNLRANSEEAYKILANEYLDFLNFVEKDLGIIEYRDLIRRFEIEMYDMAFSYDENLDVIDPLEGETNDN